MHLTFCSFLLGQINCCCDFSAETVIKAAKVRPTILSQEEDGKNAETCKGIEEKAVSTELKIIEVELTDEYQEVVNTIKSNLHPLVCRLKDQTFIPAHHTVDSLEPDYTRFLLKQFEAAVSQRGVLEDEKTRTYKMIVSVHAMITALDLITNYSLAAAIGRFMDNDHMY